MIEFYMEVIGNPAIVGNQHAKGKRWTLTPEQRYKHTKEYKQALKAEQAESASSQ
jgi:hypothetical protein